jgi:ribosomal protein S18 acetylase RimI-like enzyme
MTWKILPLQTSGPLFEGAIRVYAEAFAQPPYSDPDRGREVRSRMRDVHGKRQGFRAFAAFEEDGTVVGMIYGYHGSRGQWWHDMVMRRLDQPAAEKWLSNPYELVEVAVLPERQGQGIGAALIGCLLHGRPEATCVLSTRTDSDAHHLYRRLGFEVIVEMAFATGGAMFYVMGKELS